MKTYLLIPFICLLYLSASAENIEKWFEEANALYQQQDYENAAKTYLQIVDAGYESAELFYNLGNCYYKLNKTGWSILYFEKALKTDPDNEDVQFNLSLAKLRVNDRIDEVPEMMLMQWFKKFLRANNADQWGKIALFFIWAFFIGSTIFLFTKNIVLKRITFLSSIFFVLVSLLTLAIAFQQYQFERNQKEGVVMVTNTYVKSSPDANSTDLFMLREGTKFQTLEKINDWFKIKLADGKVGWIRHTDIHLI